MGAALSAAPALHNSVDQPRQVARRDDFPMRKIMFDHPDPVC
jgi:hypothetical protein